MKYKNLNKKSKLTQCVISFDFICAKNNFYLLEDILCIAYDHTTRNKDCTHNFTEECHTPLEKIFFRCAMTAHEGIFCNQA